MMEHETKKWKTIAIIFIILFTVETLCLVTLNIIYASDEKKMNECYYDICEGYPDAYYESNICQCYGYDMFGELVITKEKYMR